MYLKKYARLAGGFAAILLANSNLQAAEDPQHLTIEITGSRTAQTVDESLAPVTVITRKDIEARPSASVTDLLRATPGLSIVSNGGKGATASIFMRGTESDHTLILIDGMRMSSATTGTAAIQDIPLDQIERIEIVRGPRSSLYGPDAIGGVIQLFTRNPQAGTQPAFSISGGSNASAGLNAGISGRQEKTWYNASFSSFKTDGFNSCNGKPFPDGGGCFTYEPDDDGYTNNSLNLSGGVQISPRINASFNALRIDSEVDYDGDFSNERDALNQNIGGKLEISATENWSTSLFIANSKDHSDDSKNGVFVSRFNTDRDQFSWLNDILLGNSGKVTMGLDYYKDEVSGTTDYSVDSRDNTGLFAQYLGKLSSIDIQASLRGDDNEQFGTQTTGGLTLGQDFANGLRWTASYGTAFKAPTFNELYFPGFGNPGLDAETSDSFDLGLSGRRENFNYSINAFLTNIDNLIAYDAIAGIPVNIGEAEIPGVEFALGTYFASWNVNMDLSLLSPKNESSGPNKGNRLARRPEQLFNVGIQRSWNKLSTGFDVHAQGSSYDDLANTQKLAGFATLNMNLGYRMANSWMINFALNNIFDKSYETAKYYNNDGINGMLTLRYTPK